MTDNKEAVVESSVVDEPTGEQRDYLPPSVYKKLEQKADDMADLIKTRTGPAGYEKDNVESYIFEQIRSILKEYGTAPVTCPRCGKILDGGLDSDDIHTCTPPADKRYIMDQGSEPAQRFQKFREKILDEAIEDINLFVGELYAGSKLAETLLPGINAIRPVIEKLKSKTIKTGQK